MSTVQEKCINQLLNLPVYHNPTHSTQFLNLGNPLDQRDRATMTDIQQFSTSHKKNSDDFFLKGKKEN